MFKKSLPAPEKPAEVHNHYNDTAVGQIIAKFLAAILAIWLAWHGLIYLADQAGAPRPQALVAQLLFWIGGLAALTWSLSAIAGDHLDRYYEHRLALEEQRTHQMRYRQLMAGSAAIDSRAQGDQQRLLALVYLVMLDAYDHLAKNNRRHFRGQWRPWSRRSASQYVLTSLGEKSPVGSLGDQVRPFLEHAGIIDDNDQIDLDTYNDIASIHRLIYQPVLLNPPAAQNSQQQEWSLIDP